jgi:hypothetical protein
MLVKAKETLFIDGSRRKAGAVFEYSGEMTDLLEVVDAVKPAITTQDTNELAEPDTSSITKKELQRELDAAGVKYKFTDNKETLMSLLAEVKTKVVGFAGAPSKW